MHFPEWEFYDALDDVIAHKHSTEPPVVVESLPSTSTAFSSTEIGPDDETQDMSGAAEPDVTSVPSPMSSSSTTSRNSLNTDASNEGHHADNKSKKRKWSKSEANNVLLEKMVKM